MVLALGSDHPANRPVHGQDKWPTGLADLINKSGHAGGFFVNADDYFYFRGDAKTCNAFLKQYAAIENRPHRLILHPGRGRDKRPWEHKDLKPIDWMVSIENRAWRSFPAPVPMARPKGYDVRIDLWVGGNVGLDQLQVPLEIDVASSGEIERFVATHQAKQSLIRKDAASPKGTGSKPSPAPSAK